ncbi:MAG: DNA-directed RNA polymerase subunit beta' [Oscillospiraceae bacterium]|nr:DNA-directed RNA polymerase subunit beta' [Oscillospiraceae bacterium]
MEFNVFDSIKIGLASPDSIRQWSYGEVKKPETINYRTLKPERDGLFCERIFGPMKDWECYCGKYKRIRFKGKVCERCGVEITRAKVRRERMGHIELAAPVSHIWYFKGTSSRMGLLLNMSPRLLEKVLYFASYIVIDPGITKLKKYDLLNEKEYREHREAYEDEFKAGMGAEAVKELLAELDLEQIVKEIRGELEKASGQKRAKLLKRLEVVESFRQSGNKPEWMILDVLPVIPPDIRPMVQLDGGRFATSDLNDLYRRVINRNNRLKKLLELGAPDIIVRNEKRMLQEAVDALIDNGRRGRPVTGPNNRPLKSLSDMLKGKQGRFRQNLLGKRVDYSGRSVIVVGPELKMYQCGLPKEMALELFKPFVMKRLVDQKVAENIKKARKMVERAQLKEVWDALEVVIKDHPVLLNRAPTLHRLGIQAFEPVLVEGRALKLHPLVCTAYNADFDGDQMAVHVPLSAEAQAEARFLMLAANNLLKPSDGRPVAVPTQDMVLGSYYLTMVVEDEIGHGKAFRDVNEALMAYQDGVVGLHAPIRVRLFKDINGQRQSKIIGTTVGRLIFNNPIPQDLGFVDRSNPENLFNLEIERLVDKKQLSKIIDKCIKKHGTARTSEVLDQIKAQGYKFSTRSGITVAVCDAVIPPQKAEYLAEAEKKVEDIRKRYDRGLITEDVRYERTIKVWEETTSKVKEALKDNLEKNNPIYMMADSGARGSMEQIRQLAGMRGIIANTSGKAIEIPIRANYREGLNILEYFNSSRGARKGLADTALRTADSGYLTRRLVDVSQEVIIREDDCGATEGLTIAEISDEGRTIEEFGERLYGRYLVEDCVHPETGELLVSKDKMMDESDAKKIIDAGIKSVVIRSIIKCRSKNGVCAKCYGNNLATDQPVAIGEAVGIIAAQSIGEPGTQLTMRTFHTGGVASAADITQGLPRVEELFEARKPKNAAIIAHCSGTVSFDKDPKGADMIIIDNAETGERFEKQVVYGSKLKVKEGDVVKKGDFLTEGSAEPAEILQVSGEVAVQDYIIQQVQMVYRTQGVDINDKHIEVIVRQMMKKVRVDDGGDSDMIPGSLADRLEVSRANALLEGKLNDDGSPARPVEITPIILGITKASLATDSFMSAASFQETTRVLTEAAIKGKSDPLLGLKENVIIGKLVPAGTGMVPEEEIEEEPTPEDPTPVEEIVETLEELIPDDLLA